MDRVLIVTGSMVEGAHNSVEAYNLVTNSWTDKAQLNEGRYYHSSCAFKDKWVYVFCGFLKRPGQERTWTSIIERIDILPALG